MECNKACKIDKYLDIKKSLSRKCLYDKLVLACEDGILSTTETPLDDKKINWLVHAILLAFICLLLLLVISVSCYYFSTRSCLKKEYAL